MSAETRMPSGPQRKSAVWRAGAWLLGVVALVELTGLVLGVGTVLPLGASLLTIIALLLSTHYGVPWLRGEEHRGRPEARRLETVEVTGGGPGATYVLVHDPRALAGGVKGPKVKELGPISFMVYVVFWKAPLFTGDMLLSILYQTIARITGRQAKVNVSTESFQDVGADPRTAATLEEIRRHEPREW